MKIGVVAALWNDLSFEETLDAAQRHGLDAIELGGGNFAGAAHVDPRRVIEEDGYGERVLDELDARGLELSAISVHGNPIHPNREIARAHDTAFRLACEAAASLGIGTVNVFSGCPGDRDGGTTPNWVTCPWPLEFSELYDWQWSEVIIPYWQEAARFASGHGIRLGFEMHPGMVVYNPATLLRLREAAGPTIGVNFDPSHLLWQGIDVLQAVRELSAHDVIYHVHAKDTFVDAINVVRNGNIDPKPYRQVIDRAWTFRTVGYGNDEHFWRSFVSELRVGGFDGVLSIEHEDLLLSVEEGLSRAVDMLRRCILVEPAAEAWWT
jgi:sugar phosphate isomerase/epimerase